MNSAYNYYPNNNFNRMDYNEFINSMGLNNMPQENMIYMNNNNEMNNNQLFGTYEGYSKGNMFKNMYSEYKNYTPARLIPKSEQDEALLNLNQIHFAMHEANLYLDVYPNDTKMMMEFRKLRDNYNKLLYDYQKKYESLNVNSENINQVPFGWESEEFPWDRRGL